MRRSKHDKDGRHTPPMTFGSLFSGIGGFDLALERLGMKCKWQVENNEFCQKVLTKHWPDVPKFGDIRECGAHNLPTVDLICGGFPCQPFSVAGKQRGKTDDRYLWPEMLRIITEIRPTWIIGENVPGIIKMALDDVLSDLEREGYATRAFVIPACAVNAPHQRQRVWIVAHLADTRLPKLQRREQETPRSGHGDITWREPTPYGYEARAEKSLYVEDPHSGGLCEQGICKEQPGGAETQRSGEDVADAWCERERSRGNKPREDNRSGQFMERSESRSDTINCREDVSNTNTERWNGRSRLLGTGRRNEFKDGGSDLSDPKSTDVSRFLSLQSNGHSTSKKRGKDRGCSGCNIGDKRSIESDMGGTLDELSTGLDRTVDPWSGDWEQGIPRITQGTKNRKDRLRALGNAVVPAVVEEIGRMILEFDAEQRHQKHQQRKLNGDSHG